MLIDNGIHMKLSHLTSLIKCVIILLTLVLRKMSNAINRTNDSKFVASVAQIPLFFNQLIEEVGSCIKKI